MAEIPPPTPPTGPLGAVPPPKKETGKVQPKKETVRINLPPKPTAAPTIKLPTLPPGGPTGAPSAIPIAAAGAPPPKVIPQAQAALPVGAPAAKAPAPATSQQQRPPAAQPLRATPSAVVPTIKTLDKVLIYSSVSTSLISLGFNLYVFYFVLKPLIDDFKP